MSTSARPTARRRRRPRPSTPGSGPAASRCAGRRAAAASSASSTSGVVAVVALAFVGALWTPLLDVDEVRVDRRRPHRRRRCHASRRAIAARRPADRRRPRRRRGPQSPRCPGSHEVRVRRGVDGRGRRRGHRANPGGHGGHRGRRPCWSIATAGSWASCGEARRAGPCLELAGVGPVPAPGGLPRRRCHGCAGPRRPGSRRALPGALASLGAGDGSPAPWSKGARCASGTLASWTPRLRSLRTVLEQVDLTCLAVLDLRLPGSPVLTREEGCS